MHDTKMNSRRGYVLVTPVKNEEGLIGTTIESVVNQTIRPVEWVIVSDGSTDRTNEIIQAVAVAHPWIKLLKLPQRDQRCFAAVVHATESGVRSLETSDYQYIGLLDSDLRFQSDYFETIIGRFEISEKLGLAGGSVIDLGERKDRPPRNLKDIPGAAQFYRRACFESLGGLVAIPEGGWDGLTCAKARMLGYETRLFADLVIDHLKPRNISRGGTLQRKWQMGIRDYAAGYHPAFELMKCLSRFGESPKIFGAVFWFLGYCCATIQRRKRILPNELLHFIRKEQSQRILGLFQLPFFKKQAETCANMQ